MPFSLRKMVEQWRRWSLPNLSNLQSRGATAHGAEPISTFGFADDFRGETLVWHEAQEGFQCVRTLRVAIERQSMATDVRSAIERDLVAWEHALGKASEQGMRFCVLLMHGNSTSGHEWDVRKGSAF